MKEGRDVREQKRKEYDDDESKNRGDKERRGAKVKRLASIAAGAAALLVVGYYWRAKARARAKAKAESKGRKGSRGAPCLSVAKEAPLGVLLSVAAEGKVTKALLNGSVVLYRLLNDNHHDDNADNNSEQWRKSNIPSESPSIHSAVLEALSQGGCQDISSLPTSFWQRMAAPATASIPFVYLALLYAMLRNLQSHQMDSHHDTATIINNLNAHKRTHTTFADVAGIDAIKIELAEIVSYLRNPNKYKAVGASVPRGVLLHGPPGSGKTLLARALAGEANVDAFLTCTGSDFVEMYVGRGAARVRQLFANLKAQAIANYTSKQTGAPQTNTTHSTTTLHSYLKMAYHQIQNSIYSLILPHHHYTHNCHYEQNSHSTALHDNPTAILFIDEIDALAKTRGGTTPNNNGGNTGNDEREQTLNQLLSEMDGFDAVQTSSSPSFAKQVTVIVVAATNRPDVLDPALLRPGRFDRHVHVSYPDAKGREQILLVHSKRVKLQSHSSHTHDNEHDATGKKENIVDLKKIASNETTGNFSGADLSNLINEAAFLAVRDGCTKVGQSHLLEAAKKVARMKRSAGSAAYNDDHRDILFRHLVGGSGGGFMGN